MVERRHFCVDHRAGRLEIYTSLVDPRGDDGSPEAQQAIVICEAGVEFMSQDAEEDPTISVYEADGTNWILYNHPAVEAGECGEV